MSWFDLAALVVVALAVVDGARNGLLWAALETCVLVASALVARGLSSGVEPYVRKIVELTPQDLRGTAHVLVFVVSACVLFGVLILVKPAIRSRRFRHDGVAGGALGAVNGTLAAFLVFAIVIWPARRSDVEDSIAESRLVPVLRVAHEHGMAWLLPDYLPARLAELERP
jgi:uncharacterized membrane protein required for colicin V production